LETRDPPKTRGGIRTPARQAAAGAVALAVVLSLVVVAYLKVAPGRSTTVGPTEQAAFQAGQAAAQQRAKVGAAVAKAAKGTGATVGPAGGATVPEGSQAAIPALALRAYQTAESWTKGFSPGSHLPWTVVAGIGRVESNHGRFLGSAARFTPAGDVSPPIIGPARDGRPGFAAIRDTDGGSWDEDRSWDRAVGPMQFIPTTWKSVGRDGNGDRTANPHNLFDAATTTAAYLSARGKDLADPGQLRQAIYSYNHSMSYVATVLRWAAFYGRTGPIPSADPSGSGIGGGPGTPGAIPGGTSGGVPGQPATTAIPQPRGSGPAGTSPTVTRTAPAGPSTPTGPTTTEPTTTTESTTTTTTEPTTSTAEPTTTATEETSATGDKPPSEATGSTDAVP
jgi:membrane-bound lytic murein transglycosylase B